MRSAAALVVILLAAPVSAEESWDCRFPDAGLVLGDVTITYLVDGVTTADPGATLTEVSTANGYTTYLVGGFPDASEATDYSVTVTPTGDNGWCNHSWQGAVASRLVYNPTFDLAPGIGDLHVGDSLPWLDLTVSGLASSPTGATVTATFYRLPSGIVTALADETAEVVSGSVETYAAPPTGATAYRATFRYRWAATDTTTLGAGQYYVRFTVTLAVSNCGPAQNAACIITLPPARQASLRISP